MDWDRQDQKAIVKEAFKEWLDEKAAQFGKWTFRFIGSALAGAVLYLLVTHGFIR